MAVTMEELELGCTVSLKHDDDGVWVLFGFPSGKGRVVGPFADRETAMILVDAFDAELRKSGDGDVIITRLDPSALLN